MSVQKVVTGFSKLTDDALDTKTNVIVDNMTNNSNYQNPDPTLADVSAAHLAYRASLILSKTGGKENTADKNQKRKILEDLLNLLALYVQRNCQNDLAILLSSGFDAKKQSVPVGMLSKPENVKIEPGPNPGSIKMSVDKVDGASAYFYEYAPAPDFNTWVSRPNTSRSYYFTGLTSGQQYAFRVCGIGSDPTLVYSDVITRFVQ